MAFLETLLATIWDTTGSQHTDTVFFFAHKIVQLQLKISGGNGKWLAESLFSAFEEFTGL